MPIPHYDEVNPGAIFSPSKTIYNFPVALVNNLIDQINEGSGGDFLTLAEYNAIVPDWYAIEVPAWYQIEVPDWYDITVPTWASSIVTTGLPIFNTRALAIAGTISAAADAVYVANYAADGDLGGGVYIKVAAQPAHDFKFQNTGNGFWYEINETVLLPQMVGGKLQGTASDSGPMLRSWVNACALLEREGWCPEGVYNLLTDVLDTHGDRFGLLIENVDGLRLRGAGRGNTIFSADPASSLNICGVTNSDNIYLSGFQFKGKGATPGAATGFHGADDLTNVNLKDICCRDVPGYGYGWEDGSFINCTMKDCEALNTGSDACDFKNFYLANRIKIVNYRAEDWGKEEPNESGLDVRGVFNIVNYSSRSFATDMVGIRLQLDGGGPGVLGGARYSSLSNFDILGAPDWDTNESVGIEVWGQKTVVTNGSVRGCRRGYRTLEHADSYANAVSNVFFEDCRTGILISGSRNAVNNCIMLNISSTALNIDGSPSVKARMNTVTGLICINSGVRDVDLSADSEYCVIVGGRGQDGIQNNGVNNTVNVGDNFSIP